MMYRLLLSLGLWVCLIGIVPPAIVMSQNSVVYPFKKERAALDRGDVQVHIKQIQAKFFKIDVLGYINQPVDKVWQVITRYDTYHRFLPLINKSELKKRLSSAQVNQYLGFVPPWPFKEQWTLNDCNEEKSNHRLSWHLIDGSIPSEEGFFQLTSPSSNQTEVWYHLYINPNFETMPAWVIKLAHDHVLPKIIYGLREQVK
jgi:uncharacterized membrane protein